jgi:hypothetical protein
MAAILIVRCAEGTTAAALRVALQAPSAPLVVLTARTLAALERELRGHKRMVRFLVALATDCNRPIGMHAEHATGGQTVFIPPRGWTSEKLQGWIAGRHAELEAQFGPIAGMGRSA